jgi:hypothetical protein
MISYTPPTYAPFVVWVVFSRPEHHASLVLSLKTGLVPVVEVLVFFGVFAQGTILASKSKCGRCMPMYSWPGMFLVCIVSDGS